MVLNRFIIISIQMGQENSLNCRNTNKEKEQQVETTHSNTMHLARALQSQNEPLQSDIKSKKSGTTVLSDIENKIPSRISKQNSKMQANIIPQHQNLLKVAYSQFEGSQKQGSKWVEKGGKCLADIIQGRYNTNMHFPQTQIVALIESLVYALAYLEKGGIKHHDFYPINIYYSNGIFKLANPLSIQFSAYALTQQRRRFSFLSPELIAYIVQDTPEGDIPPQILFKSDIFAIGMVVLQFSTLQPSAECYDEQNYELIDQVIKERLVKVAQLYSPTIADCIAQMLVYNFDDRIPVQDLALVVYLNSPNEKVEKVAQQQPGKNNPRASNPLPPLPKPNSPSIQQQLPPQQLQNAANMQPQYVKVPQGQQMQQVVVPGGPNNIVMPPPNYTYSHIGPNNQSLLSPSSLQNKLKVIEQIHQKPEFQQDSEGQLSSLPSNFGPGNSQIQEVKVQQQPQKFIVSGPPLPPGQAPMYIQQIPPQYIQQPGQMPQQIVGPPMRQVMLPPGYQQPPQFLPQNIPPNMIQNMPPNVLQGNFVQPANVVQHNRVPPPPFAQNLPQNGIKSTQIESKYQPATSKYQEQSRYRPRQAELLSPYQGATYQNNYPSYGDKQSNTAEKDYDLLYKPSYKESLQLNSQYNYESAKSPHYRTNSYQTSNEVAYKPGNYSANKYTLETDYLSTKGVGKYETTSATNKYQGTSYTNKYDSTSIANKYARPRDQNGQTLEQRVDRILQISRGIK